MQHTRGSMFVGLLALLALLAGCIGAGAGDASGGGATGEPDHPVVFYDGNGADGGAAPIDRTSYGIGDTVTVLGRGSLVVNNHAFRGWCETEDGSGAHYAEGDTFSLASAELTFYAMWEAVDYATLFLEIADEFDHVSEGSIATGDIDGDGDSDVLLTGMSGSPAERYSELYLNDGATVFSKSSVVFEPVSNGMSDFADVDGDGDLDLVLTGNATGAAAPVAITKLYINDGSGGFSESGQSFIGAEGTATGGFLNLDADPEPELFVAGWSGDFDTGRIAIVYDQNTAGTFENVQELTGVNSADSSFGDVDGDGDSDLLVSGSLTNVSGESTLIYINTGGSLQGSAAGLNPVKQGASILGDIDGDGDLDAFLTGTGSSGTFARLYTNDGSGTFSPVASVIDGCVESSAAFLDVELDGDLDLLVAGELYGPNGTGGSAKLYINDGSGGFSESAAELVGVKSSAIAVGDLNGDGYPDVVVTGYADAHETRLYVNGL